MDAENIFRLIIATTEQNIVNATNSYYASLSNRNTRANVFLRYINFNAVKSKVFSRFGIEKEENAINIVKTSYPDTYNFLCSLEDGLANLQDY